MKALNRLSLFTFYVRFIFVHQNKLFIYKFSLINKLLSNKSLKSYFKTPACSRSLQLEEDDAYITDLCPSPVEPDQIALRKTNGEITIISKVFDKGDFVKISKLCNAETSKLICS